MAGEDLKKQVKDTVPKDPIVTKEDLIAGTTIMNLATPEPYLKRQQAVSAARNGTLPPTKCMHRMSRVIQMFDHVDDRDRHGRPTNWFECEECHYMLFLVDAHGKAAMEG